MNFSAFCFLSVNPTVPVSDCYNGRNLCLIYSLPVFEPQPLVLLSPHSQFPFLASDLFPSHDQPQKGIFKTGTK